MKKWQAKKLLKKTAELMFPRVTEDKWTFIINEWADGDFGVQYLHSESSFDIILQFRNNEVCLRLEEEPFCSFEYVFLFGV